MRFQEQRQDNRVNSTIPSPGPFAQPATALLPPPRYEPAESLRREIRFGMWLCGGLVFGLGGLATFLPMAGAVIAPGDVSVASHVKQVSHPSGGVAAQILVADGDHVTQGQPMIRFDTTVTGAAANYTGENVDQLLARAARLQAERDGAAAIAFPAELTQRASQPEIAALMAAERKTLALKRSSRQSALSQLGQRIQQSQADLDSYSARSRSLGEQAAMIGNELDATRKLYEKRYTTLDRLSALERTASDLAAQRTGASESAQSQRAHITELRYQMGSINAEARSTAATELLDTQTRISELRRQQVAAQDSYDRAVIRAPQSGVVDKLAFRTIGGFVPAGQTIMEIVPDNDRLTVNAMIKPADIDQVREGLVAILRFSAFSQRTTPELQGHITHVAADRTDDSQTRATYYRATITLDPGELAKLGELRLKPGMPAEVFIQTGHRTMLNYILKPLSDQFSRAFREN
ncbi:HlyD family type I secretion periplasmic adaptor subunit [Sphingomonas sp. IC081]|nr:HlyD family type I secretion periplasmic adaptor subunit [Sphingomonas sp. IC081]